MQEYTHLELQILCKLSDDKGHANWDIARHLNKRDSNIYLILKKLKDVGSIYQGQHRNTTNPKSMRPNQSEKPYYLIRNLEMFDSLVSCISSMRSETKEEQFMLKRLLGSDYVSAVIENVGFDSVYNVVEPLLRDPELKKIVSETLLKQKATIGIYNKIAKSMRDYLSNPDTVNISSFNEIIHKNFPPRPLWSAVVEKNYPDYDCLGDNLKNIRLQLKTISSRCIKMLSNFSSIEAVSLYRTTLHNEFIELVSEFEENDRISLGLSKFLIYDNYLSPFTSYPIHSPRFVLFSGPFQRIYEDFYLIDDIDFHYLDERARIIHDNFADILFEFFRNEIPKNHESLEEQTKQFIYQWNVASTNFDSVRLYLESVYKGKEGSGRYYVLNNGIVFKMIDLERNESLPEVEKCDLYYEALPMIFGKPWEASASYMPNPFEYLKPCMSFVSAPEVSKYVISMDQILSKLKSRFAEFGLNYDTMK